VEESHPFIVDGNLTIHFESEKTRRPFRETPIDHPYSQTTVRSDANASQPNPHTYRLIPVITARGKEPTPAPEFCHPVVNR
jgi:hypothetical protein